MRLRLIVLPILAVAAALVVAAGSQAEPSTNLPSWQPMTIGQGQIWNDISSPDGVHVWAVSAQGYVAASSDGGSTWSVPLSIATSLSSVRFVDSLNGWAAGGGAVVRTTDGGVSWMTLPVTATTVDFVDPLCGWAWDDSSLNATTDGGTTWQSRSIPTAADALHFVDQQYGYALAIQGAYGRRTEVMKTTNGGVTWSVINTTTDVGYVGLSFADPVHGYLVNGYGNAFYTDDGGTTWTLRGWGGKPIYAVDACRAWTIDSGRIFATDDAGQTWHFRSDGHRGLLQWSLPSPGRRRRSRLDLRERNGSPPDGSLRLQRHASSGDHARD